MVPGEQFRHSKRERKKAFFATHKYHPKSTNTKGAYTMKYAKIDNKSFKATETETIHREEIYTVERLQSLERTSNEHIDRLNHMLTQAQDRLIECNILIAKAKEFGIKIPPARAREKK
jgi:hypothetical protein